MALKSDGRSQLSGSGSIPAGPSDDAWHSTAAQPRLYRHGIARLFVAMNISGGTGNLLDSSLAPIRKVQEIPGQDL